MAQKGTIGYVDNYSKANVSIQYEHSKIHSGCYYTVGAVAVALAPAGVINYGFVTDGYSWHVKPAEISSSVDALSYYVYEDAEFTGGIPMTIINNNRVLNTPTTLLGYSAPTVTSTGTLFAADYLPGSVGVGQSRSGGSSSFSDEFILKLNTKYLIRFVNGSESAAKLTWKLSGYEAK